MASHSSGFARQVFMSPAEVGIDAAPCNAQIQTVIDTRGCNMLTFNCKYTRSAGTGNMTFTFEGYSPTLNDYLVMQSADVVSGVATLSAFSVVKATASASQKFEFRLEKLSFAKIRVTVAAVTSASASDTLSVACVRSFQA